MSDLAANSLWVERHRPATLEHVAMGIENRAFLASCVQRGEFPHLLFYGPPGTGKTTSARILIHAVDAQVLALNASKDRGIDVVRERISEFVRTRSRHRWNVVYMEEADRLTPEAQDALRGLMEQYADISRFVFTGNNIRGFTAAIRSRCTLIELLVVPTEERLRIIDHILQAEGVTPDVEAMWSYAAQFNDLRRMITAAEKSIAAHGKLVPAHEIHVTGQALYELATQRAGYPRLKELVSNPVFDPQQGLIDIFWAIPDGAPRAAEHAAVIARAVHDGQSTPDPVVHFLGTCAQLSTMS